MKISSLIKKIIFGYSNSAEFIKYLRKKGVTIGEGVVFYSPFRTNIDLTRPYGITIGNNVQITKGVTILTHGYDWSVIKYLKGEVLGSFGKVTIGNNVFIGTNSTILKGVNIGDNVIIGANSLVNKNCESNYVYAGNPAKKIMSLENYYKNIIDRQLNECIELTKCYYQKYGVLPPKEEYHEFFYLFEDRDKKLIDKFENKLNLMGNYSFSKDVFLSKKNQVFDSFEDFIEYCKSELKIN